MKQPKPYLLNILSGIDAIDLYRSDTEAEFMNDRKTQDIGENLSHIRDTFPEFWDTHVTNDWVKAIGLRNVISHGYADVDLGIIWALITVKLPLLRQSIQTLT